VDEWVGFVEGVEGRSAPGEVNDSEVMVRMVDMIALRYEGLLGRRKGEEETEKEKLVKYGLVSCRVA
jgi:hypothetical protein